MNGQTAKLGESADPSVDHILVDGKPLTPPKRFTYLMLHKPAGYVTTVTDPHAEHTVMELVTGCQERVVPVGRLDKNTTGLLLLTNDGELAFRLGHPRFGVEKIYRAKVRGHVTADTLEKLRKGVLLEDGMTAPARARSRLVPDESSIVEIALREGRKRQVRRMLEAVGHRALWLERIQYGPLELGALPPGKWRRLAPGEVEALQKATSPG